MTAVIETLYAANEDDVAAMAAYMATLAPEPDPTAIAAQAEAASKHDWAEGEAPGGANAPQEAALLHGEQIFAGNCITCHKARVSDAQPISLGLSAVVNDDSAGNFLRVLQGGIVPARASRDRAMPAQAQKLSAQEIADLAAFVRWRFTDLPAWSDTTRTVPFDAHQTGGE
jgi:mono/diheme cytochrome c family protein